jgi:hypothetical protein
MMAEARQREDAPHAEIKYMNRKGGAAVAPRDGAWQWQKHGNTRVELRQTHYHGQTESAWAKLFEVQVMLRGLRLT